MSVFVKSYVKRSGSRVRAHQRVKGLSGRRLAGVLKSRHFVLKTTEFGKKSPVFIGAGGTAVAKIAHAQVYSGVDKLSSVKLPYMKAVTGYKRLRFKRIK